MDASAAVDRQIKQMVDFIKLEAKEKASEIRMKTKADSDVEKQMAVVNGKTKLAGEYDQKEKQLAIEQRVKASMEERRQRSRLLAARDEFMQRLGQEAKARLAGASSASASAYSNLLKGLVRQGLERLSGEAAVHVLCRPQDLAVAQSVAPLAAQEIFASEGRSVTVTVAADAALGTSAGGVVLTAFSGKIRCVNTLEERLGTALVDLTPVVRDLLFPSARAEVRTKPPVNFPHAAHQDSGPIARPPPRAAAAPAAAPVKPGGAAAGVVDPFAF